MGCVTDPPAARSHDTLISGQRTRGRGLKISVFSQYVIFDLNLRKRCWVTGLGNSPPWGYLEKYCGKGCET